MDAVRQIQTAMSSPSTPAAALPGERGGPQPERPPLVATKFERPPLPATYASRARIETMLSRGAEESCQLTLVSAPPGYGKTVAVRGWVAGQRRPCAWLTLDDGDDDPTRFVRYLIAALRRVRPEVGERTAAVVGMSGLPSIDLVVATLLDEIAVSDAPFILVLDDYHLTAPGSVQDLVARLVAQMPPFVQMVLVTRQDPELPLARLRAHGRLVELRADDLRYTAPEAAALMTALGVELDAASAELLADRTEGWAAGIQLAALTLRGRTDAAALIAGFGASHRYVIDYLADEVMARLSDDLRSFLEKTSVTVRLCARLADALTGRSDSDRTLREVEERNLFLLPIGLDGAWYRYHHLFADYLRSRLSEEDLRELQFRAAEWCSREGLTLEATRYALGSQKWPAALPIVAAGSRVALALGEPDAVLRWTEALPGPVLGMSPDLLADRAWAAFLSGQMPAALAAAKALATLDDEGRLEGDAGGRGRGIRAWLAVLDCHPDEGERLARLALESLADDPFFRELTLLVLGDACWDLGRVDDNAAAVREALRLARDRPPTLATYVVAYIYAVGCDEQGRRPEAERVCREMLAASVDPTGRISPATGPMRVGLGMLAYEADDLGTAAAELEAGFALCRGLGIERVLGSESRHARVMTLLATKGLEAAASVAQDGIESARQFLSATRVPSAEAVGALVALRAGDARSALSWANRVMEDSARIDRPTPKVRLHRDLAVATILVATGASRRAETIALEAGRSAAWVGSVLGQIQASILTACAAEQQGRRTDARSRLAEAVALAAPGGYIRRFVEDAPPVAHLLPTVRAGAETFVDAVVDALEAEQVRMAPGRSAPGPTWRAEDGALMELLTQRELDVLRLLARGRSNAGIGDALGVSRGTAKWHVANVLGKLGASSRTQAAARARELGIL